MFLAVRGVVVHHLADWRRYRLMTQNALAKAAGVSRMTVSRAENSTPIDGDTIRKLAKALRISVRHLTTTTPPADAPESPDTP